MKKRTKTRPSVGKVVADKVRLTLDLDLASGDYDMVVNNLSQPGGMIDLGRALAMVRKVLCDAEVKADGGGSV
jgi:hypothetical protein